MSLFIFKMFILFPKVCNCLHSLAFSQRSNPIGQAFYSANVGWQVHSMFRSFSSQPWFCTSQRTSESVVEKCLLCFLEAHKDKTGMTAFELELENCG